MKARDPDVGKAEKMLRESFLWRQQIGVDKADWAEKELDPFFKREFQYYIESVDKHGQPVVFIPMRKWDFRKVITEGRTEELKTFMIHFFEFMCSKIEEKNKERDAQLFPLSQVTCIVDWNEYSYMQLANLKAVQSMLSFAKAYEAHYPERLFRCYYINCPSFFNVVLALIKTVIAPRTLGKITVHGGNQDEWMKALQEHIDDDQISLVLQRMK